MCYLLITDYVIGLEEEGIFRVSGSKREVMEYKAKIDQSNYLRSNLRNPYIKKGTFLEYSPT